MNGYQYEQKCAELLKKRGFSNINVTKASGDQGVDIICYKNGEKYGVQCKYYENVVGNKAIQEVYAGASFYDCDKALVITNSTLTNQAHTLAAKLSVEIWENIDAIFLQQVTEEKNMKGAIERLTQKEFDHLSQVEKNAYSVKIIDALIQQESIEYHRKYPFNEQEHEKIKQYAADIKKELDEQYVDTAYYIGLVKIEMKPDKKNERFSISTEYKRKIRELIKEFGVNIKLIFDKVDKYAKEYKKTSFSVSSIVTLANLIEHIFYKGTSMVVTIGEYSGEFSRYSSFTEKTINYTYIDGFKLSNNPRDFRFVSSFPAVVLIDRRLAPGAIYDEKFSTKYSTSTLNIKDNNVARFSWPEKYQRKYLEWTEYIDSLSRDPLQTLKERETEEKISTEKKIASNKEKILKLNSDIEEIKNECKTNEKKLNSLSNAENVVEKEFENQKKKLKKII